MLIIATVEKIAETRKLVLAAYSYSDRELSAVDAVFAKAGISSRATASKRLLDRRPGRLYRIHSDDVYKLERLLQVRFVGAGRKTGVEVDPVGSESGGGYHCERVVRTGFGKGCVDVDAHNMDVAIVKCALIARSKKWFGAVAEKGPCSNRAR